MKKFSSFLIGYFTNISQPYFLAYLIKCIIGVSICYGFYLLFPDHQFYWSMISVLLVLAPDHHDSVRLSIARMKANFTGATVGLMIYMGFPIYLPSIAGAVVITILICTLFKLGNATRSALAALIIVLIQQGETDSPRSAFERVICVVLGCIVALVITEIFSHLPFIKEKKMQS